MSPLLPAHLPYSTALTTVGVDSFRSPRCWSKDWHQHVQRAACPATLPYPTQSFHSVVCPSLVAAETSLAKI